MTPAKGMPSPSRGGGTVVSPQPALDAPVWSGPVEGYRHEALLWRTDEDFLAVTVPFVADGVRAGQPVMVAMTPERLRLLSDALGSAGDGVTYVDMTVLGRNPARIIPAWLEFVTEADGPVRGIGEPIYPDRDCASMAESQLHEALLNLALGSDIPLWLLCPYHVPALGEAVVEAAWRSHPRVLEGGQLTDSSAYQPLEMVDELFTTPLPPVPRDVPARMFRAGELPALRAEVFDYATACGVSPGLAVDLALAVHEIAANSVEHAGGSGTVRLWTADGHVMCEVQDEGMVKDRLIGRRATGPDLERGRGVWMANHLCDLVQIRSGQRGTTVRLRTPA